MRVYLSLRLKALLRLLPLVGALALVSLNLTAFGAEKSVTLDYPSSERRMALADGFLGYAGFSTVSLPSGLRLALETVKLPLQTSGRVTDISFSSEAREYLGAIDPAALRTVDIPTADDGRYGHVRPPLSELFTDGFNAPVAAELVYDENGLAVQLTVSPYEIDAAGNVYAREGLTIRIQSLSALTVGKPIIGAPTVSESIIDELTTQSNAAPGASTPEFLIITNIELEPQMRRLAEYRGATGTPAQVKLIEDILAGSGGVDDAEALREFLKGFYLGGGSKVLFAGDETVVPIRHACYYNTSAAPTLENLMICDLYFADLTGDWDTDGDGIWGEPTHDNPDLTPELRIGRLPLSQSWQAKNYIDKLILYETNPGFGDRTYLEEALIFASDQMRDHGDSGQHAIIARAMPGYFEVDTFGVVESPRGNDPAPTSLTGTESVARLEQGFGVVNIISHGRHDGFVVRSSGYNEWPKSYVFTEDVIAGHGNLDSLKPNGRVGLYVALSCDLAAFDFDLPPLNYPSVSFAEKLISSEYSGAVGMVANSRWGWVYSSYRLQSEFLQKLFGEAVGDPVAALNLSESRFPYYRDLIYGQNYYGDPAMRVHLVVPQETRLETDVSKWGSGLLQARVVQDGAPQPGARVILSSSGIRLAEAQTGPDGTAAIMYAFEMGVNYTIATTPAGALVALESFTPSLAADVETDDPAALPHSFALRQNYPNPFNPTTTIGWSQPQSGPVTFRTLDILGRTVYEAQLGTLAAGDHTLEWDAMNNSGKSVAS
ncbi:MAG: C25 family cysteine peptidase, partial [Candidatus Zixiibacteriota bacterium]